MVAGDCEDGAVVIAIGIVELIVVVAFLAEEIDDVAQVIAEGRQARRVGLTLELLRHSVSYSELVRRLLDSAAIAERVEHDLAGGLDLLNGGAPEHIAE